MPATLEVKCVNKDYELGMFELRHTHDIPDDMTVADFSCSYYGESRAPEEIQL